MRTHLSGSPHPATQQLLREITLAAAQSLVALGRTGEVEGLLAPLRDGWLATREGAMACAVLQANGARPDAYRGKYAGDPDHARRMQRLWQRVPAARKRLAAALGWDEARIATPWIGVADANPDSVHLGAVTEGDPQCPLLPGMIVCHSEPLAIGLDEPETLLVHELAHATLMQAMDLRYEAMPVRMQEGLAQALSGEIEDLAELIVAHAFHQDGERFLRPGFWERAPLVFDAEPCDPFGPPAGALLVLELCAARDGLGLKSCLRALRDGKSWQEALEEATGLAADVYLERARARARQMARAQRAALLPGFARLHAAARRTEAEALAVAEDTLAAAAPRPVRGRALALRAEALERQRRTHEALAAWRELLAPESALAGYVGMARRGTARCLLALGRREEYERCLTSLERDALQAEIREWATARLRELRSAK